MKYLFSLVPVLFLLSAQDCSRKPTTPPEGPTFKLGETLSMNYQEPLTIAAEKLRLTYVQLNDSRCPEGVDCIRAGEAIVYLAIDQAPMLDTIQLEVKGLCKDRNGACGNSVSKGGYVYKILTADPYPKEAGNGGGNEKSSIRLIVNKEGT